jgi:prepilin-type N-terminal cleavage/methylation domain-containing protein
MDSMNENGRHSGFSLVELCIVLAATAVLAAFSVPMFNSSLRGMQLSSEARNIATTLTYAKLRAMSQMTNCRLSFTLDSNQWTLQQLVRGTTNFTQLGSVNTLSLGVENSGIAFKSSSDSAPTGFSTTSSTTITYSSRGTLTPLEACIVYLSSQTDDYAISVSISGKVQVWRHRDNQWTTQ